MEDFVRRLSTEEKQRALDVYKNTVEQLERERNREMAKLTEQQRVVFWVSTVVGCTTAAMLICHGSGLNWFITAGVCFFTLLASAVYFASF